MTESWLKLHRQSLDSQYFSMGLKHIGMFKVLLLKANWKVGYFQGVKIKPGSFGTSISGLAEMLSEDRRTVRKLLDDLEKCGVITRQNVANRWTHITICNWSTYQHRSSLEMPTDSRPNDQPSPDQVTIIEEGKKDKNLDIHISEHLQNLIFSSFGGPMTTNVSEWLSNHSEQWIIEAIARAEASGKCKPQYVNAILKGWQKDGYPREDSDKAHYGAT